MKKVKQMLEPLQAWFISLNKRERIMVGAAAILVPVYLLMALVVMPATAKYRQLQIRLQVQQKNNSALELQLVELNSALAQGQDTVKQQELERLQQKFDALNTDISTHLDALISPEQMPALLRRLLSQHPGLVLHSIKNAPPELINPAPKTPEPTPDTTTQGAANIETTRLYRHPLVLQIAGPYLDALSYLEKIGAWPEHMLIDSVEILVQEYPLNMITLQLSSISTAPELLRGCSNTDGECI